MTKNGPVEKFNLLKTYADELRNAGYEQEDLRRMSCDELRKAIEQDVLHDWYDEPSHIPSGWPHP